MLGRVDIRTQLDLFELTPLLDAAAARCLAVCSVRDILVTRTAERHAEARDILREAPGIMVIDKREDGGYITPVECVGEYATYISRIRQDGTIENGLNLWCVSDNLRKGAALNAVQIAELLGRRVLKNG